MYLLSSRSDSVCVLSIQNSVGKLYGVAEGTEEGAAGNGLAVCHDGTEGTACMIHTVVVLQEDHVVAAEYGTLKNALHEFLGEAEEIHGVLDLDDLGNVIVRGQHLEGTAQILNSSAVIGPGQGVIIGVIILVVSPHLIVPMPLNGGTDELGGVAVTLEGSLLAFYYDGAEVILALYEVGQTGIVANVAVNAGNKALLQIDNEQLVGTVGSVEEFYNVEVDQIGVLVALNALEDSFLGFCAVDAPGEGLLTGEVQGIIVAAIHDKVEALSLQFAAVSLAELIDGIKRTGIISKIQNRSSPFL